MKIIIKGEPIAKKRHRVFLRDNKIIAYDPQASMKSTVSALMKSQVILGLYGTNQEIDENAPNLTSIEFCDVSISFYLLVPKSSIRAKIRLAAWDLMPHGGTPDLDNMAKFILDCGNGILWKDDRKISRLTLEKKYSNSPRVEIEIKKMKDNLSTTTKKVLETFSPNEFNELLDNILKCALEENEEDLNLIAKVLVEISKYHRKFAVIHKKHAESEEFQNQEGAAC